MSFAGRSFATVNAGVCYLMCRGECSMWEESLAWLGLGSVLCFLVRLQGCVIRAHLLAKHDKWLGYYFTAKHTCIWLIQIGRLQKTQVIADPLSFIWFGLVVRSDYSTRRTFLSMTCGERTSCLVFGEHCYEVFGVLC